jgi:LysR family transcriptional regulator, hydrogen peroxide-inducible genes activator
MEMHQVRYFVALAETLNFTRAAERCNVAQPSLTRAIRLLEDELGGPLFHRERNNTHLTELGRLMEPHLREVLEQSQAARRRASSFFALKTARLKLGVARGIALQPLEPILQQFARAHPETEIQLIPDSAERLGELIMLGDLELALLRRSAVEIEEFHHYPLFEERLEILMSRQHPLADLNEIDLAALAGQTVVTAENCPFWIGIEQQLQGLGIVVGRRIIAGEVDWLRPFVAAGLGVGLRGSGHLTPDGIVSRSIAAAPITLEVRLATRRGRLYSAPVKAFVDMALKPRRYASGAVLA